MITSLCFGQNPQFYRLGIGGMLLRISIPCLRTSTSEFFRLLAERIWKALGESAQLS